MKITIPRTKALAMVGIAALAAGRLLVALLSLAVIYASAWYLAAIIGGVS